MGGTTYLGLPLVELVAAGGGDQTCTTFGHITPHLVIPLAHHSLSQPPLVPADWCAHGGGPEPPRVSKVHP
eukprot:3725356-Pyramimonas_sp.AAC.1